MLLGASSLAQYAGGPHRARGQMWRHRSDQRACRRRQGQDHNGLDSSILENHILKMIITLRIRYLGLAAQTTVHSPAGFSQVLGLQD